MSEASKKALSPLGSWKSEWEIRGLIRLRLVCFSVFWNGRRRRWWHQEEERACAGGWEWIMQDGIKKRQISNMFSCSIPQQSQGSSRGGSQAPGPALPSLLLFYYSRPRVEWYTSLRALDTSPPRNCSASVGLTVRFLTLSLMNLISVTNYDEYSAGPSIRPICTRNCLTMNNMIQVCSNLHWPGVCIINTCPAEIYTLNPGNQVPPLFILRRRD